MTHKKKKKVSDAQLNEIAVIFSAMGDLSRLKILRELMHGPKTVSEIVLVTDLKQANVSKQLGVLHNAHLVERKKIGTNVQYSIKNHLVESICDIVCVEISNEAKRKLRTLTS